MSARRVFRTLASFGLLLVPALGLAQTGTMRGLLGRILRRPDRESLKPFVLVQVKGAEWKVVFTPPT